MPNLSLAASVSCGLLAWSLSGAMGCTSRAVGAHRDGGPPDAQTRDGSQDASRPPDAAPPCEEEPLEMGFVLSTLVPPSQPLPGVEDFALHGLVVYHGDITVPLAANPAFRWEVQVEHPDASLSIVQYFLPETLRVPAEEGMPTEILFRRRQGFEGFSVGLVVRRPTSGLPPLLFVADVGTFGRAFGPEDPATSPLRVTHKDRPECPGVPDPDACGALRFPRQLRFDSSTGGQITAVTLPQGASDSLPVFGEPFQVTALASSTLDPPCPGTPTEKVAYLAVNEAVMPETCDPSLFLLWNDPYPFGVGDYCDLILFCPESPQQKAAAMAVAPSLQCGVNHSGCEPDAEACIWHSEQHAVIDQGLYDEICAVSVLPDPPPYIQCRVFL